VDSDPAIDFAHSSGFVVLRSPTTEPIDSDVVQILKKARILIEQRDDWSQGNYRAVRERRCAIRALCDAAVMLNSKSAGNVAGDLLASVARRRGHVTTSA
jgi:hypothetical protein